MQEFPLVVQVIAVLGLTAVLIILSFKAGSFSVRKDGDSFDVKYRSK
jgi:hypothetical protein